MKFTSSTCVFLLLITTGALAAPPARPAPKPTATQSLPQRSKSIKFENEVVEGMATNPLDSLENIARKDRRKQDHLYQKRTNYKPEIRALSRDMGYAP